MTIYQSNVDRLPLANEDVVGQLFFEHSLTAWTAEWTLLLPSYDVNEVAGFYAQCCVLHDEKGAALAGV